MTRFDRLWTIIGMVGCCLTLVNTADAGVFSGVIESISERPRQVVVKFPGNRESKSFRLSRSTILTLDNQDAGLDDFKPGDSVSVWTDNGSRRVQRVAVRRSLISRPQHRPVRVGDEKFRKSFNGDGADEQAAARPRGWPQFRGPNRDNISGDRALLSSWPKDGPPLLWTARGLGEGYSSVSVAGGKVFTMGTEGVSEVVYAFDLHTGEKIWTTRNGRIFRDSQGNGPRSTPTVDGTKLYVLGASGDLSCLDSETGEIHWRRNILQDFGAANLTWGISESVLIDGRRLICTPGGSRATMVALDKDTGETIWKSIVRGNPRAAYSSAIVADVGGVRQCINFTSRSLIGIRARDGELLWEDTSSANSTANCSSPIVWENLVFSASNYGTGGTLLELKSARGQTTARQVYRTDDMKNHHGGMVLVDGYLYGSNDPGILMCLDFRTGRFLWQHRSVGKASLTYADDHLYIRSENGPVALVRATPLGYQEKGRFEPPRDARHRRPTWSRPVVTEGKLFLRDMDLLHCYDVSEPDE